MGGLDHKANVPQETADVDLRNCSQGQLSELPFFDEMEQEAAHELHRVESIPVREQHHLNEGLRWQRRAWTVVPLNSDVT